MAIEKVYFPESGLVSVVAVAGMSRAEAGIIGSDGVTGHAVILGGHQSPNSLYMMIGGRGLSLPAEVLRHYMHESDTLRMSLHNFISSFLVQSSFTALAYTNGTLAARLARWLLMANDRVEGDRIAITHEFLSTLLGVRRAGVTVALASLVSSGLVATKRSDVQILDRVGLEKFAGDIYGIPEAEQSRLTGWLPRQQVNQENYG